jgi:hypothetical protein
MSQAGYHLLMRVVSVFKVLKIWMIVFSAILLGACNEPTLPIQLDDEGFQALRDATAEFQATGEVQSIDLVVRNGDEEFLLTARPTALRGPAARVRTVTSEGMSLISPIDIGFFEGEFLKRDEQRDFARFAVFQESDGRNSIRGAIVRGGRTFRLVADRGTSAMMTQAIENEQDGDLGCDQVEAHHSELSIDATPAQVEEVLLLPKTIRFAVEADYEYVRKFGSAERALKEILSIVHIVEGVYASQFSTFFEVTDQRAWLTEEQPFASSNPRERLRSLFEYGLSNFPNLVEPGVVHLFTGRNLDGFNVGRAYIAGMCSARRFGVSSDLGDRDFLRMVALVTHELGHNFGMTHDSCGVADLRRDHVMCPRVGELVDFTERTVLQARDEFLRLVRDVPGCYRLD